MSARPAGEVEPGGAPWRRLSERMLFVAPVLELARSLPALLGLLVLGAGTGRGAAWSLAGALIVILVGFSRWFTTTYRITGDQVQLRRGLLRRRLVSVARDRVRTVDVTASAMHRLAGLAKVTVGTGRSDRRDDHALTLDALTRDEAGRLREELLHRGTEAPGAAALDAPAPRPREAELAQLDPRWIRFGPFTLSGLVAVGVLAGLIGRVVSESHVDPERFGPLRDVVDHLSSAPLAAAVAEVLGAALVVVAVASTLGYVLAYWRFRLSRHEGGTLHVTRGLITTRATSIEERRLRGVELSETLLLRVPRGARCVAIATGLRVGRGADRGGSLLLPPAPRGEAARVAAAVLGSPVAVAAALLDHGPAARRRRYTRALAVAAAPVAAALALWLAAGWPAWVWAASLALPAAAALLAADRRRSLGHAVAGGVLVSRRGSLARRRAMLSCEGIVGWNLRRSFFQRRVGLATLVATTAAGRQGYEVQDVEANEALRVVEAATPGLLAPFLASAPPAPSVVAPGDGRRGA